MITLEKPVEPDMKRKPRRWPYIVAALVCAIAASILFAHAGDIVGAYDWSVRLVVTAATAGILAVWPGIGMWAIHPIRSMYTLWGKLDDEQRSTAAVILVYVALASIWAFRVHEPLIGSSCFNVDEIAHIVYANYLGIHHSLPPYTSQYYESIHPPLYYAICSLVIHYGVIFARLINVLIGITTLTILFKLARLFSGIAPTVCVAALAFYPGFLSLSGSVTNDGLAVCLGTSCIYQLILACKQGFTPRRVAVLGIVLGLGCLTKYQCIAVIPALVYAVLARKAYRAGALSISLAAVISGWWYVRNIIIYGDAFRKHAEMVLLGGMPGAWNVGNQFQYWFYVTRSALAGLDGAYWNWLPAVVYWTTGLIFALVVANNLRTRPKLNIEEVCLVLPILFGLVIWASYNYEHFMPNLRLCYPVATIVPLLVGRSAHGHARTAILTLTLIGACAHVMFMPNNWATRSNERTVRSILFPYRETPFPTAESMNVTYSRANYVSVRIVQVGSTDGRVR